MNFKLFLVLVLFHLCAGCTPPENMFQMEWNARIGSEARTEFAKTMKKGERSPAHDFVSQYDFANAALDDLPWELHLLCVFSDEYWDYCESVRKQHPDWNYLEFNFPNPEPRRYERVDEATCRLTGGIFTGELTVSNGTVFSESGDFNDGFQICDIGFTDVNQDGFMDAVLLLVQQGGGSARVSGVYVLTRKQSIGRFSLIYLQASRPDKTPQTRRLWKNKSIQTICRGGSCCSGRCGTAISAFFSWGRRFRCLARGCR